MNMKPVAANGFVFVLTSADAGDILKVQLGPNGEYTPGLYFFLSGSVTPIVSETGEQLSKRSPGWLNLEHPIEKASTPGTMTFEFQEKSSWVCIPHLHNVSLPKVSSIVMKPSEERLFLRGTTLFLAAGSVDINNKQFVGPAQIRIRSGESILYSETVSYFLLFEQ